MTAASSGSRPRASAETILRRLDAVTDRAPDKVFCHFIAGDRREAITYRSLREESRRYAGRLSRSGVRHGDIVAIMLRHVPDLYYAFLGAMTAGAVPTFMPFPNPRQDPGYFWSSHRELFEKTGISTLIADPELAAIAGNRLAGAVRVLGVPAGAMGEPEATPRPVAADAGSIAFLQHSSGTTGRRRA